MVAKIYTQQELTYNVDTFFHVAEITKTLLIVYATKNWNLTQLDISNLLV